MIQLIADIIALFPNGVYRPPCTEGELAEAEEMLGTKVPEDLRTLYLHFNGFDVLGSPSKLFPLLPRHANTSLVKSTLFWRTGPGAVANIIFFGMSEKQYYLGATIAPQEAIVEYNYDLDEPQVIAPTIIEAYVRDIECGPGLSPIRAHP